jgi:hypothetical protein
MRASGVHLRVGLMILGGIALLVGLIWFLAGSQIVHGTLFETYFSESVQGLEVGAAVKYRGVTIGRVTDIGLTSAEYGGRQPIQLERNTYRLVFVRYAVDTKKVGQMPDTSEAVSLGLRIRLASQGITGSAGFFSVKAGRLDWFSPYDYAVLVGGNNIQILNFTTDGNLTPGTRGPGLPVVGCVNDVAVGNFNNTVANPNPPPATTIDPTLQIAVLTSNKCDGGIAGGIGVTLYNVDPQTFFVSILGTLVLPSSAMPPTFAGLYQNLAVGDLQGRSLALGPPQKVTVTGSIQPQVILGLPPMHIDFIQDANHLPNGTPAVVPVNS